MDSIPQRQLLSLRLGTKLIFIAYQAEACFKDQHCTAQFQHRGEAEAAGYLPHPQMTVFRVYLQDN